MNSLKKKKHFKLPHAFTLLFMIAIFFGILSLILNWSNVSTMVKGKEEVIKGAGFLDWFIAIPQGIVDGIWIIVFLFVLGGFINIVVKSEALESIIGRISTKFPKNYKKINKTLKAKSKIKYYFETIKEGIRQTWVIIPLMLFFSFCGMSYGMAEESLAFYAIIIPVALAAGFDVWTGFLIIFIGAGAGVMGSIINPFSVGAAVDATKGLTTVANGIAWRSFAWVIFTVFSIIFVMFYAASIKKNKNKSKTKDLFEIHNKMFKTTNSKNAPTLTKRRLITSIIFLMTFVVMIIAMLQWDKLIGVKDMKNLETKIFTDNSKTSIIHNSSISRGWETTWEFGNWYMGALAAYFFIISIFLAFINKTSEKDYIETMISGAKDMLGVALAIGIARSIPFILEKTHMQELFANGLSKVLKQVKVGKQIFVPALSYVLYIPLTFIIPSTSGLAQATFGTIGESFKTANDVKLLSGTITGYAWGAGLANMIVPTYGVVIGALAITKIPYDKFLKLIIKPFLMLFVLGLILMLIGGGVAINLGSEQTIF